MPTIAEELTTLKSLLDQGILTQEEFNAKKTEILTRGSAGTSSAPQTVSQQQPFGVAPQQPYSGTVQSSGLPTPPPDSKSKIAAGLLAIFLGSLGIHKFYLGYTTAGIVMLLVTLLGSLILIGPIIMSIIALIEGIIYLTKTDEQFYLTYVVGDKPWF